MLNSTTPGTLVDSPVSRPIRQMARSTCGLPPLPEKTIGFRLRSLGKNGAEKNSTTEEPLANADVTATVAWSTPEPIVYGTKLSGTQLDCHGIGSWKIRLRACGRLHVAGWNPYALGDLHTRGHSRQRSFAVRRVGRCHKATPAINWPAPAVIPCGAALSDIQLNATASVPGKLAYTPPAGEVLTAGKHELLGYIYSSRHRELCSGAGHCVGHSRQGAADLVLAGASSDYLCYRAQRCSAQCHGIGSREIRIHPIGG